MIDIKQIEQVVTMFSQSSLGEVIITDGNQSIRVVNTPSTLLQSTDTLQLSGGTPQHLPQETKPNNTSTHTISSPAVGWFYTQVKQGDKVNIGDVVANIKALGVLTPVLCDKAGVVHEILLKDGDQAQWGQMLMHLSI
ncbi:hypothetical protein LU293_01740 [Moraxella nasovis]|uniref:acetyl-CoA carboxylase biotin carboxyl carrier protein n=1 Tax=Moraxella nasovis TaxID=2904121 RepID=UPI001F609390|nr:biotin/lipoyl-containing protein [Moraxella nasovis]UNU73660.1 hypothetical protein LU293_01740 [Moraxella nasovis]